MDYLLGQDVIFFTVPALVGTLFFAIRLALSAIGGDMVGDDGGGAMDLGDFDAGMDGLDGIGDLDDAAHADSTAVFKFLSIQAIIAFAMGFGWGGFGAVRSLNLGAVEASVVGIGFGIAFVWLLTWLLKLVYSLQSSGNVSIRQALGREASVYVAIPEGGSGQVSVVIDDRQRRYNARSAAGPIPRGQKVRITQVNPDNTVLVARA